MSWFDRPERTKDEETASPQEILFRRYRILFLSGPILGATVRNDSQSPTFVTDAMWLMALENPKEPIRLVISSEGGMVSEGLVIYDMIKLLPCPVYTIGKFCCSMAAVLLAAGEKGHRYVFPHSRTMLHLPAGQVQGDAKEVEIQTRELTSVKDLLVKLLQDNGVSHSRKKILEDIDREFWLTGDEAIKYGIVDKVVEPGILGLEVS